MASRHRAGRTLREARQVAGLTQEQVADALGLSRQTIVGWEQRALVKAPKADSYLRVVSDLASRSAPAPEAVL